MLYRLFKSKIVVFTLISIFATSFATLSYVDETKQIKKIISIVYDDSGSMSNNGQDYAYASYGLQNIIGLMNPHDKLNIVKMSEKDKPIVFHIDNYDIRKKELEEVKSYQAIGTDTDFRTVETALEYLYDMKSMYGEDSSYEYYLVVITDGQFDNYPKNLTEYLSQIPKKFGSSIYNGIFIGIGENIPARFEKDILSAPNNYYVKSDNNDEIVNALYVAHDIIYDRTVLSENEFTYDENNSMVTFTPSDKVNSVIIFEQNQQVPITDVSTHDVNANEKLIFACAKNVNPKLGSYIIHASNTISEFPKEKIVIVFLDQVDVSKKNFRVMVEYAGKNTRNIISLDEKDSSTDQNDTDIIDNDKQKNIVPETDDTGGAGGSGGKSGTGGDTNNKLGDSQNTKKSDEFIQGKSTTTIIDLETTDAIEYTDGVISDTTIGLGLFGCSGCSRTGIGLGGCGGCNLNRFGTNTWSPGPFPGPVSGPIIDLMPRTPSTINNPWIYSIYSLILAILPMLILLALLYGYLKKPRFDMKEHAFEKYEGKKVVDSGSMIKVNKLSKFIPYAAETGFGNDLAIKAAKKKDRIIIPKKYLTNDMRIENQEIDLAKDLQLFENMELTKVSDDTTCKYVYRYHPILDKNN